LESWENGTTKASAEEKVSGGGGRPGWLPWRRRTPTDKKKPEKKQAKESSGAPFRNPLPVKQRQEGRWLPRGGENTTSFLGKVGVHKEETSRKANVNWGRSTRPLIQGEMDVGNSAVRAFRSLQNRKSADLKCLYRWKGRESSEKTLEVFGGEGKNSGGEKKVLPLKRRGIRKRKLQRHLRNDAFYSKGKENWLWGRKVLVPFGTTTAHPLQEEEQERRGEGGKTVHKG